jgi:glutamate synthase (ferredoxin)
MRVEGGIKSGWEVVMAACLGADQYVSDYDHQSLGYETRVHMAELGYRTLDEMIGQTYLLTAKTDLLFKASGLDLSKVLDNSPVFTDLAWQKLRINDPISNGELLDDTILNSSEFKTALRTPQKVTKEVVLKNGDRSFGTRIAGTIASGYGERGFLDQGGLLTINAKGTAGQSFGAFCTDGMQLYLEG